MTPLPKRDPRWPRCPSRLRTLGVQCVKVEGHDHRHYWTDPNNYDRGWAQWSDPKSLTHSSPKTPA